MGKKLIFHARRRNHYTGEFTEMLDRFCVSSECDYKNYLYGELSPNIYVFRLPGCTTGQINVDDDNIIKRISIHSDNKEWYKEGIEEEFYKFVGRVLVLVNGEGL